VLERLSGGATVHHGVKLVKAPRGGDEQRGLVLGEDTAGPAELGDDEIVS
jgi:hypothetical protein